MMGRKRFLWAGIVFAAALLLFVAWALVNRRETPAFLGEADLRDGRVIRVEGVSFGKKHEIGNESLVIRALGPWLPQRARGFFEPKVPRNRIERDEDVLVVWVNAINPVTQTHVDCQAIRLEFIDENGTTFGDEHVSWFGGLNFWRAGHVFEAFPRGSKVLRLRITSWKSTNSAEVVLPNPGYTIPASWTGKALPQKLVHGEYEVVLKGLNAVTNNATYWRAASPYWKPTFEILWKGVKQDEGWDVEWIAEDRYGNRGEHLGLTEPILKFTATFHPNATNLNVPVLITRMPPVPVSPQGIHSWNLPAMHTVDGLTILGLFPAGIHVFSEGQYLSNPPVSLGATRGGARTGWVGTSRRETPSRTRSYHGHYSDTAVIYVRVRDTQSNRRLGMRLIDDKGRVFLAMPEPQGASHGILPFILRTPPEVTTVTPELVFLPAIKAEFVVNTPLTSR